MEFIKEFVDDKLVLAVDITCFAKQVFGDDIKSAVKLLDIISPDDFNEDDEAEFGLLAQSVYESTECWFNTYKSLNYFDAPIKITFESGRNVFFSSNGSISTNINCIETDEEPKFEDID